jgi:predicted kinase
MLIAFGGLPGTGKTTIAQALARKLAAVYLRIDTLEQALIASGDAGADIGPAGYLAAIWRHMRSRPTIYASA